MKGAGLGEAGTGIEVRVNFDRIRYLSRFIHRHASHFFSEVIYNNYITQRIQFQFDKIASIQYSILLLLFMIT